LTVAQPHDTEAEDDLRQIGRYLLGEAGLAIASRIQEELVDAFEGLAGLPGKGHKRSDLTSRDQYMIVYRRTASLEIVAILHGKRDIKRLLERQM
jgi:plasmid stabilization system protein ParE